MRKNINMKRIVSGILACTVAATVFAGSTISAYADNTVETMLNESVSLIEEADKVSEESFEVDETLANEVNEAITSFDETVAAIDTVTLEDLNKVSEAFDAAVEAYGVADEKQKEAEAKYEEAAADLEKAEGDSEVAKKNLEEAKAVIEQASKDKEELKVIEEQYYGTMVYYYRTLVKNNAVYNEDGTMDFVESAKAADQESIDKYAKNPSSFGGGEVFNFTRCLTKELVEYMLIHSEGAVEGTIVYGEEGNKTITSQEAVVILNNNKEDQTLTGTQAKKDNRTGETLKAGEKETLKLTQSTQKDSGRTNRTKVTFKDADGVEHTEYYNGVYKSSEFGDETDVEDGLIYIALIKYNEEKKAWEANRVEDENNYDSYSKLKAAIATLEAYEAAKADVETALTSVAALEEKLAALQGTKNAAAEKLAAVRSELNNAKAALEAAEETKANLEASYVEAQAVVASVDADDYEVVIVPVLNESENVVIEEVAAPTAAAPVAVAPVASEEIVEVSERVTLTEAVEEIADANAAPLVVKPSEVKADETAKAYELKVVTAVAEDEVPLFEGPHTVSAHYIWWFVLVLAAIEILAAVVYVKKHSND